MLDQLESVRAAFAAALAEAGDDPRRVEEVRVRFLGRKGEVTALMKLLGKLDKSERPAAGQKINALKSEVEAAVESAKEAAASRALAAAVAREREDVTLPAARPWNGSLHPVTQTRRELEQIFREMGFSVETGPEVEDDFHNFEALNMPPDHPARDAQDTFYLEGGRVLRTHTSPVQIRTMEDREPPIKMVCPGRVYRRDFDATHLPMFHQLEALVVGERVTMADLKGTLARVWRRFFGDDAQMRIRPGYFPFVEPGFELDARCPFCEDGCRVCKGSTWVELCPCGMVHPNVLRAGGIDPERYTGFAFGLGLSRLVMLRHGIDDIRHLLGGDLRFLEQF